jgi:HAD superfamily hydrolase (TIGR01549 family)
VEELKKDATMGKSLIIVDFDGTMVHLEADWQALRDELENYCLLHFSRRQTFRPLDDGLFDIKREVGDDAFVKLLEIVSVYELRGYRGKKIERVIHALRTASATKKIAVFSSNCRNTIEQILPRLDVPVSFIVAKDDVAKPKPHGEGLKTILAFFNANPEDALYIGDNDIDLQAGSDAGIRTVLWRTALE